LEAKTVVPEPFIVVVVDLIHSVFLDCTDKVADILLVLAELGVNGRSSFC